MAYAASFVQIIPLAVAMIFLALATRVRGTTLIAPRNWAIFACLCAGTAEVLIISGSVTQALAVDVLRYASGITTFAPFMALLGAKRPQNRGWQFVVLTLLVVLALPALSSYVYGSTGRLQLPGLISVVIWVLIGFEVLNFLFTLAFAGGIALALAQISQLRSLLAGTTWLADWDLGPSAAKLTVGALIPAVLFFALCQFLLHRKARELPAMLSGFRALFGATWTLRIMQMFNAGAEKNAWPIRLGWWGMERVAPPSAEEHSADKPGEKATELDPQQVAAMHNSLRMLLRRFVSPEWIDARWDGSWGEGSKGSSAGSSEEGAG